MEARYPEIVLSDNLCSRLKLILYPDKPWIDCYNLVVIQLSDLRAKAKAFYSDKDSLEILKELIRYSDEDLLEMLGIQQRIGFKASRIA
jgi:hypothetical protein